ncbi:hypothetical protein FKP32DRAFT_1100722 [Trametes sanguinea]|nr:hypothetical protein FKP32DRAFT_1100722 [Trametes sanguinea]
MRWVGWLVVIAWCAVGPASAGAGGGVVFCSSTYLSFAQRWQYTCWFSCANQSRCVSQTCVESSIVVLLSCAVQGEDEAAGAASVPASVQVDPLLIREQQHSNFAALHWTSDGTGKY